MRKISILLLSVLLVVGCSSIENLMEGRKKTIQGEKIEVFSPYGIINTSNTCNILDYPPQTSIYRQTININAKFEWNANYIARKFKCLSNIAYSNNSTPIITNSQNIVVMDMHGSLTCYSLNGNMIWNNETFLKKNKQKSSKQILQIGYHTYVGASISYNESENAIYSTDTFGSIMKTDAKKGTTLWYSTYHNPLITTPQFFDDFVITASINSEVVLFDKNNGKMLLAIPKEEGTIIKEIYNNNIIVTPLTKSSALIAVQTPLNGGIKIYKINITQTEKDKTFNISTIYSPATEFFSQDSAIISTRYNEYTQSILQYKTGYIVAKKDGTVEYYDVERSDVLWRKFYHPTTSIVGAGDLGYFINANTTLLAIKLCDGSIQWKYTLKHEKEAPKSIIARIKDTFSSDTIYSHPVIAGNRVVLRDSSDSCLTFDMLTGNLLSTESLFPSFHEAPIFQNGMMFLKNSYHILALYPKNIAITS
ncbi:outer membrane protein assembly factor BamB family protein [Candidatus Fokinia crypta]|uniref:Outer membrane protein assembly factor BamB n=1 Tax=Candidatus Fokinia crypta TaxID=1920990 RepID=A0ABZ0UP49_9RICK|nr:PQQ-binding-like beta-propeller repeat protein [Candidatus Fokinia cryptica]WPX97899.1 Outer membrane protein assembly factor BamB [Candidatus Fokinia cryptica]